MEVETILTRGSKGHAGKQMGRVETLVSEPSLPSRVSSQLLSLAEPLARLRKQG
jgi:hypothetical protein